MALGRGLRDTLLALAVVAAILGVLFLYTSVWPPMVVVESGSMMHINDADPPFGRYGTIDPGDLVIVKGVDGREDVTTMADAAEDHYGSFGDVIVYYPLNDRSRTPIIHRAVAWVDVKGEGTGRTYEIKWAEENQHCRAGKCTFDARGVYLPSLGFDSAAGFSDTDGWKPPRSGFITKGDNPRSNPRADPAAGISCSQSFPPQKRCEAVDPSWIEGKAQGELPWFGLIKLAVGGKKNMDPQGSDWLRIGWAWAPRDLWAMLALSLALLIAVPVAIDAWKLRKKPTE